MQLVYSFIHKNNNRLYELCRYSKNLYNQALYIVKNEYKQNGKYLNYYDLDKILKNTYNLEGEINYKLLKAQVAQQCLRILDKNIKSFYKSNSDYKKNPNKYKSKPQCPKYKDKNELNLLVYTNQVSTIKDDGYIYLSKDFRIQIPQFEKYKDKIKNFNQIRIIPLKNDKFKIEIVYKTDIQNIELDYKSYSSIDLGINNLATMIFPEKQPLLFNGRILKSYNQYFNKKKAKLQSQLKQGQYISKRIQSLYFKRDNFIKDYLHKTSRYIINLLIKNKIGTLVVGYNSGWKDSINISKRNNQTFVNIPHLQLINYLKYKCEMVGIKIIVNEESYTSKCDGLALEEIKKHKNYKGKRVKRGLFQSSLGKLLNADVNGALNILRKVIGDSSFIKKIINSGCLCQPKRINVFNNYSFEV